MPLILTSKLPLAAHFPDLHVEHYEVEKGADLVFVVGSQPQIELFLQNLLSRVVLLQKVILDIAKTERFDLVVFGGYEQGCISREEAI